MTFCLKALLSLFKVFLGNNDLVNAHDSRKHSSKQRQCLDTLGAHGMESLQDLFLGGIYPGLAWDYSPL